MAILKNRSAILQLSAFLILYLLLFTGAYATSLNEALISSYKTNPEIKSAILALQSVDEEMPLAISGMLPSASASLQRSKKKLSYDAVDTSGITDTKSIEITQPLFKGGRTYASIKKAKNDIMAAREHLKIVEQQVLLDAVSAYMDIVRDKEIFELAKNNHSVLKKHLESTQTRFKLGDVTRTDVAQSNASLAKANSDRILAERTLESSKATYIKVIGMSPNDVSMPKKSIFMKGNLDELIKIALQNNPYIKTAEYNADSAKNNISVEKSTLLPQLVAFANKNRQMDVSNIPSVNGKTIDSSSFGIRLSIPLYQAGAEYAQIRKAKIIAGKNSFDLITTQNNVRESVIKAYQDFNVAQSLIKSDQSSVNSFAVALKGVQQENIAGLRTTIDVLDAENDLYNAKATLIASKANEIVSSYNLLAQLGRLTTKELGLKTDGNNNEIYSNKLKYQIIGF